MTDSSTTWREIRDAPIPQTPIKRTDQSARVALLRGAQSPATPRTPTSQYGSPGYGSPGAVVRTDDGTLVFQFDERCMRAGLSGEPSPRSTIAFSPRLERRVGDCGGNVTSDTTHMLKVVSYDKWGTDHELWQMDVRTQDSGHVYDKLERAIRHAIVNDLLMHDSSSKRLIATLPPLLPLPLLSTLLMALFTYEPAPSTITLLSNPTMSVFAAGLRSGLVVDLGWHETVVTAIYEYREITQQRTVRGMKLLSWEMKNMLKAKLGAERQEMAISLPEVEDVVARLAWCPTVVGTLEAVSSHNKPMTVPLGLNRSIPVELTLPFSSFATPVISTFFPTKDETTGLRQFDDDQLPLHFLVYHVLLRLPIDLRDHLLSRVIVTGNGADIPGLSSRLLGELSAIIAARGWDPVHNYGSAQDTRSARSKPTTAPSKDLQDEATLSNGSDEAKAAPGSSQFLPTHLHPQLNDRFILNALRQQTIYTVSHLSPSDLIKQMSISKHSAEEKHTATHPRAVHSLGAWAGASLASALKVPGIVQITRDDFMKHGLNGAERSGVKHSVVAKPEEGAGLRERLARRMTGDVMSRKDAGGSGGAGFTLGSWG